MLLVSKSMAAVCWAEKNKPCDPCLDFYRLPWTSA